MPDYRMNLERARFTPISTTERLLRSALRGNTEARRQFFLTIEGLAPRELFFGPENMGRLMASIQQPVSV